MIDDIFIGFPPFFILCSACLTSNIVFILILFLLPRIGSWEKPKIRLNKSLHWPSRTTNHSMKHLYRVLWVFFGQQLGLLHLLLALLSHYSLFFMMYFLQRCKQTCVTTSRLRKFLFSLLSVCLFSLMSCMTSLNKFSGGCKEKIKETLDGD